MADRGRCSPAFCRNDPSLAYALDDPKGWKNCWGGFNCFSPRSREKYQRAETDSVPGPMSVQSPAEHGSLALDLLNQVSILPPVMCAPPSSPASFGRNGQSASSHVSPLTLLTLFPDNSERLDNQPELRLDAMSTDTHSGLFMLGNALVTPPLNSTLTTASVTPLSTAPFTPPPELAHLTTPSSPEVPFAQLLGPSLGLHGSLSDKVHEHLSLQSSPPDNLELIHQLYPGSSIGRFVRSKFGASSPETLSSTPEMEKGSTNATVVNDRSVSALGNASFEGFSVVTSETMCHKPVVMEQVLQQKAKGAGLHIHDNPEYKNWHERQYGEECCSRCGELSARCEDLSEALEQTKTKLTLVERRVNSIDERERKFKQLMQWMQMGAKLQQQDSFQLSKELSWQEAAFSDFQECYLAESSISIPNTGGNDT